MRERIARFMEGRYGNDGLNQFLMVLAMILLVISIFGPNFFYLLALILLIYVYFRMFSRNITARAGENQWYLRKSAGVRNFFAGKKRQFSQSKEYHIYKCPNCKQKIRVPRGRGKIEIRCQKCGTKFIKKS